MIGTSIVLFVTLLGLSAWLVHSHVAGQRLTQREIEIATRGEHCQGRILAVQRPFLFESTTRLYFEYAPPGADRPLQCCHTERRMPEQIAALLPSAGTSVTVRYLPESPHDALIGNLVSRAG